MPNRLECRIIRQHLVNLTSCTAVVCRNVRRRIFFPLGDRMHRTYIRNLVRRASIPVALFIGVVAVGCDPVRRVEQSVVLKITSLDETSSPGSDSIAIREYHQPSKRDLEFERFNPNRREQMYPWTQYVKTDNSGRARILYGVTMLDGSKGNFPPRSRNPLEGHIFIVRIRGGDDEIDELNLEMAKGTTAQGRSHLVTVEKITKAVYVNPN